jgi:hypothetical protein
MTAGCLIIQKNWQYNQNIQMIFHDYFKDAFNFYYIFEINKYHLLNLTSS